TTALRATEPATNSSQVVLKKSSKATADENISFATVCHYNKMIATLRYTNLFGARETVSLPVDFENSPGPFRRNFYGDVSHSKMK
ncbi:MAG: hypothetical protein ACOYXT_26480, partial [Bacteroidota bacterium]